MFLTVDPGLRGCGCAWWGRALWSSWALLRATYVPALGHESEPGGDAGAIAWMAAAGAVVQATRDVRVASDVSLVVVETMKVYTRGRGDPADLIALSAIAGGVFASFPDARPVGLPAAKWKGQVPRDVMGARVEARLRRHGGWDVVQVPSRKTHLNDVMHAVGIGFWLLDQELV